MDRNGESSLYATNDSLVQRQRACTSVSRSRRISPVTNITSPVAKLSGTVLDVWLSSFCLAASGESFVVVSPFFLELSRASASEIIHHTYGIRSQGEPWLFFSFSCVCLPPTSLTSPSTAFHVSLHRPPHGPWGFQMLSKAKILFLSQPLYCSLHLQPCRIIPISCQRCKFQRSSRQG